MQYFLPSQSVDDIRFMKSNNTLQIFTSGPGLAAGSLTHSPSALTAWS